MASIQKEINNADSHMTLQSLTVIKDIKSKGLKTIKTELESVKKSTQQFAKKQNEFWNNISSDGIIAVNEKTLLKKEWQQIDQTHTAILKLAQEGNLEDSEDVKFYDEKYNALYEYLFSTLKLFDDMSKTTNIANRDKFNSFFADYYEAETEIQTKLAIGMVDVQGMRILDNLNVIGLKDEIAIYLGKLYQYVNNEWVLIPSDGYLGIKDNLPTGAIGQFFLAGDSDFYYPIKIKIGENFLQTTDGRFILATKKVEKGFIYAFTETGWVKIIDKNDYRYIIAINDLITLGESLSDNLQGIFDAINGRLDDAETSLKDKIEYVPSYLGMFESDPKDAKEGDWYVYNGVETTERNKGKVYLYQMNTAGTALSWVKLTPSDTNNSKYFMAALKDVLASMKAGPGYFSEVFCNVLFANAASISALQTKTISLSSGGMIKSNDEIYEQKKSGMCISSDGNADFNGDTHIGGNLTVDGKFVSIKNALLDCGEFKVEKLPKERILVKEFVPENKGDDIYNFIQEYKTLTPDKWYNLGDIFSHKFMFVSFNPVGSYMSPIATSCLFYTSRTGAADYIEFDNGIKIYTSSTIIDDPTLVVGVNVRFYYEIPAALGVVLENIPSDLPSTKGRIWNDKGYLRIV